MTCAFILRFCFQSCELTKLMSFYAFVIAYSQHMENHISTQSYLSQPLTPATPSRYSPVSKGMLGDDEFTR